MALESKVTSKGQVTIPKEIRSSMGITSTGKVSFTDLGSGLVLIRSCDKPASEIFGLLSDQQRTLKDTMTIEEMNEVVKEQRLEAGSRGTGI
ncbi:MAG: AbrB/MazE/SpoVT family DNA-binding domain-containing protein [Desulfonatronovibrio sp.]